MELFLNVNAFQLTNKRDQLINEKTKYLLKHSYIIKFLNNTNNYYYF